MTEKINLHLSLNLDKHIKNLFPFNKEPVLKIILIEQLQEFKGCKANHRRKVGRTCIASLDGLRFPAVEEMGQLYGVEGALGPFPDQVGADVERRHGTFPDDAKGRTTVSGGRVRASH